MSYPLETRNYTLYVLFHRRPFLSLETLFSFNTLLIPWRHFCFIVDPIVTSEHLMFHRRLFCFIGEQFCFIGDPVGLSENFSFHQRSIYFVVSLETLLCHWKLFRFIGNSFASLKKSCFIGDPFVLLGTLFWSDTICLIKDTFCFIKDPLISSETHSFHWRHFCVIENSFVLSNTLLFNRRPFSFIEDLLVSLETLLFH